MIQNNIKTETDRDEKIKKMFKLMMEALIEGEQTAFLGYEKYDKNKETQNSRNGYYKRDLPMNQPQR